MYYNKDIKDVFREFETSECGLSDETAKERQQKYGLNKIKEVEERPIFELVLDQIKDPLIIILLIAGLITIILGKYIDSCVILVVIIINSIIGFSQEFQAEKAIQSLKDYSTPKTTVVRNNKEQRINSYDVVPGDIVVLTAGNRVTADLRLFEDKELEIDESMFTGESFASSKNTEVINCTNIQIADQKNMAFMGTIVTQGRGKGVAVRTGDKTELGKISLELQKTKKEDTPLQKKLARFSKLIGALSLSISFIIFILGILTGHSVSDMALFAISTSVAIVPEGLPIVVTITMAVGLKRMAKRNVIIRKLIAVETLGSCNYICSDKTGTITENKMTVTTCYTNGKEYRITGEGYKPEGKIYLDDKPVEQDEELYNLLLTGLLCNDSDLYQEDDEWKIDGDPTEGALIVAAKKFNIDEEKFEYNYELIDTIPFSSNRQYMATLYKCEDKYKIFVKGAPERIVDFSPGKDQVLCEQRYKEMAQKGLRVLGLGYKELENIDNINLEQEATSGLTFAGFVGIIDPPKINVVEAINNAKKAGINVVMITGDHEITARSIAKSIGIIDEDYDGVVVNGKKLGENPEEYLNQVCEKARVYARVSPIHKLKIVECLQNSGNIVAVTGDGVNDAPALKKSSIGVAMGKAGTDVAKEASDMILKDDNFSSIFKAVEEGRVIYENIRKVIYFLLGSNAGIALSIIISLILGLPLPFLATQVLWINLATNGLQDIALAYEPKEKDLTRRPPRNPNENIINRFMLRQLILSGTVIGVGTVIIYWHELSMGRDLTYARTAALNTVVFFQFFHVLNARSFNQSVFKMNPFLNDFLVLSLILAFIAQYAVLHVPAMQLIFHTVALSDSTFFKTVIFSLLIIAVMEIDKLYRHRKKSNTNQRYFKD